MRYLHAHLLIASVMALAPTLARAGDDLLPDPVPAPSGRLSLEPDRRAVMLAATPGGNATMPAAAASEEELAKKLQNPIADLISIPLQYNADFDVGPKNATFHTLNVQPVIPVSLNDDWNVITRTIVPLKYNESTADGVDSKWGLGDVLQSFFLSPKESADGWIWGAGPVFLWPTATDDQLGGQKWGIGPTAVVLKQDGGWTYGMLANHVWSYAGDSDRGSVNATLLQPFLSYTTKRFTTFSVSTESTYDWNSHQWTVPLNAGVSQLLKFGDTPVQLGLTGRIYAEGPSGGPDWGVRFTVTFLLPK